MKEQSSSGGFLKGLGVLFIILFIFILPLSLLAFDAGAALFNAEKVKTFVADEVIRSDLVPAGLAYLSELQAKRRGSGEDEPDIVKLIRLLQLEDWRTIRQEILPNEILVPMSNSAVQSFYDWIDSEFLYMQVMLEMQPLKDRVNSEHGANSIMVAYGKLKPCTDAEVKDFESRMAAAKVGDDVPYNLCVFPDPYHEDQFNDYVASLQEVVNNVPVKFNLTAAMYEDEDTTVKGSSPAKDQLRLMRALAAWAWLLPLLLVLAVAGCSVRSLLDVTRWLGVPLLVGGLLTLVPPLLYSAVITAFLSAGPLAEFPALLTQELIRVIVRLAGLVFDPMLMQALTLSALGLLLVGLGAWLGRKEKPAPPAL
ncbi:MAG TPA: hypothetical protein PKW33_07340 [Anaerolineaceae bacterium]|nr:hypothetical protein [Anaerolineaceae bacterium]HPN51385.1 hypothetical protein [Anaerolineaceae bacterium]